MNYGEETFQVIQDLNEKGINKITAVIRHSARNYDEDLRMEPFMWLTEEGKSVSMLFGENLPPEKSLHLYSSYLGRCIETAYLVDKGFSKNGRRAHNTVITSDLAPFYVLDLKKIISIIMEQDLFTFLRNWISKRIDESVLMPADISSEKMISFITKNLHASDQGTINICVSHDWNIYLLKEFGLNLPHEEYGKVDYLEGVVFFEDKGKLFMINHQVEPKRLPL